MSPHSILKASPEESKPGPLRLPPTHALPFAGYRPDMLSPRVHFPPTPSMISSTHQALPSHVYDRAPITVSPNTCMLPERDHSGDGKGSYFHPRAYEACQKVEADLSAPSHTLSPDLSSDDSDLGSPSSNPSISISIHQRRSSPSTPRMKRPKIVRRDSRAYIRNTTSFSDSCLDGCLGGF